MSYVNGRVRLAVDAMGGDYAPNEIIRGAIWGAEKTDVEIIFVGPSDILESELAGYNVSHLPIRCVGVDDVIKDGEHPVNAIRSKPSASIVVAVKLVKSGVADALISAGPTGAASASAIQILGMLPGLERPAVCVPLVGLAPDTILVDGGANVDCKPRHFLSFAIIGSIYAQRLLNISNPRIALLTIGSEEGKGNKLIQRSYSLLQDSSLNFIGNIEGNDILSGRANVIVCDGVIGNILMKFYESLGHYVAKWLEDRLNHLPSAHTLEKLLDQVNSFTKLTETAGNGGGLLWGVNGVVHLLHGNSKAQQLSNAVVRASEAVKADLVSSLGAELSVKLPATKQLSYPHIPG